MYDINSFSPQRNTKLSNCPLVPRPSFYGTFVGLLWSFSVGGGAEMQTNPKVDKRREPFRWLGG